MFVKIIEGILKTIMHWERKNTITGNSKSKPFVYKKKLTEAKIIFVIIKYRPQVSIT